MKLRAIKVGTVIQSADGHIYAFFALTSDWTPVRFICARIGVVALLLLAIGCAAKKPSRIQPEMRVIVVHDQFEGCKVIGKTAICECSPVHTNIDSKSGKTTVVCRFHVENPQ